jgi:hypothetical protein
MSFIAKMDALHAKAVSDPMPNEREVALQRARHHLLLAWPRIRAVLAAANLARDHMDGNDVPEWLRESYVNLGQELAALNDEDEKETK